MSFARFRPQGDLSSKLKELKIAMEKEVAQHAKRRDIHRSDRMALVPLELNRLLFYHAPRTGPEFDDDGKDTFQVWETYAFDDQVYSSFVALTEATEAMIRKLTVRWGSAAAGSVGDINLRLLGKDKDATAGDRFERYSLSYSTGEYFDNEAYQPQRQSDGWRSVLQGIGADQFFTSTVGDVNLPAFAPSLATEPDDFGQYLKASFELGGKKFLALMHTDTLAGGKRLSTKLSTADLKSSRESLDLLDKVMQAARQALGDPSEVTLELSFSTRELPTYLPLLRRVGSAFPLVNVLMPYKKGFPPLVEQQVEAGQVHAYPLLILKRYAAGIAPISPMLAVNAVHTADQMWIELQSSQRPDLIERATAILGGEAEFWQGAPETRWGWYPEPTWPGLPRVECAAHSPGATKPADIALEPTSTNGVSASRTTAPKTAGKSQASKSTKARKKSD